VKLKVIAFALAAVATGASAQIVSNGSFETFTGAFGGDGGAQLIGSSTTLTGWTIVGGEIAVLRSPNSYNLAASVGNNFLDLAGYTNAGFPKGLSQLLTGLTVGQSYAFSMDLGIRNGACVSGGNNCHGPVQASATIGTTSQTFTEASDVAGNVWGTFGFGFLASSSSMLLTIDGVSLPAGNQFVGLDNVTVTPGTVGAVPEPETYALMLAGLAVVGSMARRRSVPSASLAVPRRI
jgi:PEP-CTERM motif